MVFEDAGFSAKNTDRPKFQEMMSRIRAGEFTHLLVWKIDRVSRNLLDFTNMYAELKALGVTFIFLCAPVQSLCGLRGCRTVKIPHLNHQPLVGF